MSRRATIVAVVLLVPALLVCLGLGGYVKYVRVMRHVEALQEQLGSLEARGGVELLYGLEADELRAVRDDLVRVGDELEGLKAELGPAVAVAPHLGWLPVVGGDVAAGADLLDMGIGTSAAADLVFVGLQPLLPLLDESGGSSSEMSVGQAIATALAEGQPQFLAAQVELEKVGAHRARIDKQRLSPKVSQLLARLDRYLPLLETGVDGLVVAPSLLGVDEPRTYLLLAQNEHELRATGGFISSVALLRVADGRIVEVEFNDSYGVDDLTQPHPDTPEALERYMLSQIWLLRDANWYADFPTSAEVASDLYQLDQGVSADGVVAADLTAVRSLVRAIEPIKLEGYDQEVTGANVLALMKEHWSSPAGEGQTGDWWAHRKDFMGDLLGAMKARLETDVGSVDLGRLMDAVRRGLGEKHVLVYMVDPTVGEIMRRNGWDGALAPTEGDFVMVVDTNMGFNKLNPNVETAVEYQVTLGEDDSLTGRVVATYRNDSAEPIDACVQEAVYPPTYQEMMEGCYWNYLRLYVPEGSELLEGPLLTLPEGSLRAREDGTAGVPLATEILPAESGKGVFGVFFVVRPGERREMVFEYKLPSSGVEGGNPRTYRLLVQKQPGTGAVPIRVVVSLPTEAAVVATHPEASDLSQSSVVFETDLREDREFEVTFQR